MRRPGEARRQSIVFARRNPQRNGIRRIPILKLRLAVELLNKQTRNVFFVSEFLGDLPYETADNVAKALVNGLWKCFGISITAHILDERNTHLAISE